VKEKETTIIKCDTCGVEITPAIDTCNKMERHTPWPDFKKVLKEKKPFNRRARPN